MHWWDLVNVIVGTVSSLAAVVAIIMAGISLVAAKREGTKARLAIARERRLDFELQTLKEIADAFHATLAVTPANRDDIALRLRVLPDADVPSLRALNGVRGLEPRLPVLPKLRDDRVEMRTRVRAEISDAIQRRLDEREAD